MFAQNCLRCRLRISSFSSVRSQSTQTAKAELKSSIFGKAAGIVLGFSAATVLGYQVALQTGPTSTMSPAAALPKASIQAMDAATHEHIENHPLVKKLRMNRNLKETRPHLKIPEIDRPHNLTAGVLAGPGRITVPPYCWGDANGNELYVIAHLGTDVCGHDGIVHGGLLSTLLDEGLARCCFPALPNKIGVTANLTVDFRAPAVADQYFVLKAHTTKVEGRKAWVEGHIETLPPTLEDTPIKVAEATALFIEPKYANLMKRVVTVE